MKDEQLKNQASGSCREHCAEYQSLLEENIRLKALLARHQIPWLESPSSPSPQKNRPPSPPSSTPLSTKQKLALFRALFQGRTDAYPKRWESTKGTSGYTPACGNEWRPGICGKPRIKCRDCPQRALLPVTDQVIYDHLAGKQTIGVYPLLADDTCRFLAIDFDKGEWRKDVVAFMKSCRELTIPASLEISRSGNGSHVWIFFSEPVIAREARQLGSALISHTCHRTRQLSLTSYDRLFPNQDTLPKGGFGNLIALPLQKQPRTCGFSVFVDEQLTPYQDQWKFLASIRPLSKRELEDATIRATGGRHPLDVSSFTQEEESRPWERSTPENNIISGQLPKSISLVLANQIFILKKDLPQPLLNRLIRTAAFQNPEFYKAQAMRLPVWNK
ncbi:MAG TPA: DNA primase small subunit domain-containing protein [Desulfomicrobiaceae bacterium]|nr:DNA primase small subunit domain-containing protein [Desulfomicrobiaceae bacterium]